MLRPSIRTPERSVLLSGQLTMTKPVMMAIAIMTRGLKAMRELFIMCHPLFKIFSFMPIIISYGKGRHIGRAGLVLGCLSPPRIFSHSPVFDFGFFAAAPADFHGDFEPCAFLGPVKEFFVINDIA